jgi:NAD(P)-dependent dehydrogenase (short-subunit alcohol dehydrogenase family)
MKGNLLGFGLEGKTAIITGAGRGIGAKCAEVLAKAGAQVIVTDVLEKQGDDIAAAIRNSGGKAVFEFLDVTDERQWQAVIEKTITSFGGLEVLVNNAAITGQSLLEDISLEDFRKVMAVNIEGVFLGTKHAIRTMKPGGQLFSGQGGGPVIDEGLEPAIVQIN